MTGSPVTFAAPAPVSPLTHGSGLRVSGEVRQVIDIYRNPELVLLLVLGLAVVAAIGGALLRLLARATFAVFVVMVVAIGVVRLLEVR